MVGRWAVGFASVDRADDLYRIGPLATLHSVVIKVAAELQASLFTDLLCDGTDRPGNDKCNRGDKGQELHVTRSSDPP
jgi:hypothetical protein